MVGNQKAKKGKRGLNNILNTHYCWYLEHYKKWMEQLGYASNTVKGYRSQLALFFGYLQEKNIHSIYEIHATDMENFNSYLHLQSLCKASIQIQLRSIALFSNFLEKTEKYKLVFKDLIVENTITTTRDILTQCEVKALFSSLETTPRGMLHRALLHLCYSCGLRASEVLQVLPQHLDYNKQLLYVVPGKNYHGRYVPFSKTVAHQLKEYQTTYRGLINPKATHFIVSSKVVHLSGYVLRRMLKNHILKGLSTSKHITLHCFRHSIATHLLQQGMDLENIAHFLGHRSLKSTQIYVRISHEMIYENEKL